MSYSYSNLGFSSDETQALTAQAPRKRFRKEDILSRMRIVSEQLNKNPTSKEWDELKELPAASYIVKIFGSWTNMLNELKRLPPRYVYELQIVRRRS